MSILGVCSYIALSIVIISLSAYIALKRPCVFLLLVVQTTKRHAHEYTNTASSLSKVPKTKQVAAFTNHIVI